MIPVCDLFALKMIKRLAPLEILNFGYYEVDDMSIQLKLIQVGIDIGLQRTIEYNKKAYESF